MQSCIGALLGALPTRPTGGDLDPVVEELARACQQRAQPRKSLALHLRNARGLAPAAVLGEISERVIEVLDRRACLPAAPRPTIAGAWVDLPEAARILGLQRATLTERLKAPEYRHLYGWPHWDGHQWWFSSAALDPAARAEFMARLPGREPAAHAAMLPPWCRRQDAAPEAIDAGAVAPE